MLMKLRSGQRTPACFRTAAQLDTHYHPDQVDRRTALLINPFYAKAQHASFGKHVLTPTLALTSIAASTPPHWSVSYWDENLLQGAPPVEPFPAIVGITVHLTLVFDRTVALIVESRQECANFHILITYTRYNTVSEDGR
jgi:hypothetical protein